MTVVVDLHLRARASTIEALIRYVHVAQVATRDQRRRKMQRSSHREAFKPS